MLWKCDIVKHELRVKSLKPRLEIIKARVKIQKCEFKYTSYKFKSTSYEFKSTTYEFKSTSYEFKSTNYELISTSYEFKSTSSKIIKSTQVSSLQIYTRNWNIISDVISSRHKGILNKHLCEKPVFLWRFEHKIQICLNFM